MAVAAYGYLEDKDALSADCTGSRGRCAGSSGWSSEERYCIDILTQISAATTALDAIALELLEGHVGRASPLRWHRATGAAARRARS